MPVTQPCLSSLTDLAEKLERRRAEGPVRVVLCHGVFDLLHIGHIRHLKSARQLGDLLVVTVTPDRFVNKGPGRPVFPEHLRLEALAALECVDYVAANEWPTAVETIGLLKPDLYVKGQEYRTVGNDLSSKIVEEESAVKAVGGTLTFTDEEVFSSSHLINAHLSPFPVEVQRYLEGFRKKFQAEDVIGYLDRAQDLKVLVIGEAIIDEYVYCEAIGKSSKDPTLVSRYRNHEVFAGGILALANHVANFCHRVSCLTMIGHENPRLDFVEANLADNVRRHYAYRKDGPTIVKRRIIDQDCWHKLTEIYELNDNELDEEDNARLCALLEEQLPQHDVVIVVDYGHGFLSREAIRLICEKSKFLAVNAQSNAGNLGYHTISTYPRADFATITEKEIRLEARQRRGELNELLQRVNKNFDCPRILVTQGSRGCLAYERPETFYHAPAIAKEVVDRVGAGDALLSIASLVACQEAPLEIVALAGNAAGAMAVATVCNREPLGRVALLKQLKSLLA